MGIVGNTVWMSRYPAVEYKNLPFRKYFPQMIVCAAVAKPELQHGPGIALIETPSLKAEIAAGKLPEISRRLPESPLIVDPRKYGGELGRHGGTLKTLFGRQKDIRMITVYGYGRLIGYTRKLEFAPDILESLDTVENRIFTMRIRKGHRWSDGHPFTAEDFRYYWEDVANNMRLSPFGPTKTLLVDGEPPRFEILDPLTVRYS